MLLPVVILMNFGFSESPIWTVQTGEYSSAAMLDSNKERKILSDAQVADFTDSVEMRRFASNGLDHPDFNTRVFDASIALEQTDTLANFHPAPSSRHDSQR